MQHGANRMGMGMMFLSLFFWFPFIVVPLVISIRAMWLALTRPANYRAEPVCERCRYRVGGLSTFTCPECGTDLRRTGIITPAMEMRRRGSTLGALAGWSLLLVFGGLLLGSVAWTMALSGAQWGATPGTPMVVTTPITSSTTLYKSLEVSSDMSYNPSIVKADITVVLTDNAGAQWKLTIDPNAQTCRVTDAGGTLLHTGAMGEDADVKALYDAAKIDTTNTTILAEIKELSRVLTVTSVSPYAQVSTMPFKTLTPGNPVYPTTMTNPTWNTPAADTTSIFIGLGFLLLVVVWIGGVAFIIVRRKRLARELVQLDSPRTDSNNEPGGPAPLFPAATPG